MSRVLMVGGGGREDALSRYLLQSPERVKLFALPGNPGMAWLRATCLGPAIRLTDATTIAEYAVSRKIDLVVIGPEGPLAAGLADQLRTRGVPTFGPSAKAALIETSKIYARRLMARMNVPQPGYAVCTTVEQVDSHCYGVASSSGHRGFVVKADGLAAGKGAVVCDDIDQTIEAARRMFDGQFGEAGKTVLIEDRLYGEEVSLFVLTDGRRAVPLLPAQDYKRAYDNDEGPNTGGMGSYAPAPVLTPELVERAMKTIVRPTLKGLAEDGAPFEGCLYAGLMVTRPEKSQEPELKVIEFNCRFGDPEVQSILPLLDEDLLTLMRCVALGLLPNRPLLWQPGCAVTVVLASQGYPGNYETGKVITGIEDAEQLPCVTVFHAGTQCQGKTLLTSGGRNLNVTAVGEDFTEARVRAYDAARRINFAGKQYRRDIAARVT